MSDEKKDGGGDGGGGDSSPPKEAPAASSAAASGPPPSDCAFGLQHHVVPTEKCGALNVYVEVKTNLNSSLN